MRGKRRSAPSGTSQNSGPKRTRQRTSADPDVVQLEASNQPNPGSRPAPGDNLGNQASGHTPNQSRANTHFIDFESIIRESAIMQPNTAKVPSPPRTNPQSTDQNSTALGATPQIDQTGLATTGGQAIGLPSVNLNFVEETIRLGTDDISCHVPAQICQKIWADQYININILLKGAMELQGLCSGGVVHVTNKGFLESRTFDSRPELTKDKVPNIEKWTDAFLIFTSIYLKKHPSKAQELLQYMNIIREAASRSSASFAWRSYDEAFRVRQASDLQSWGKINPDLWLRLMSSTTHVRSETPQPATKANCLDFNNGFCNFYPCRFTHACSHCGGTNHGRASCFKLTANANRGPISPRISRGFNHHFRGGRPVNRRGNRQ